MFRAGWVSIVLLEWLWNAVQPLGSRTHPALREDPDRQRLRGGTPAVSARSPPPVGFAALAAPRATGRAAAQALARAPPPQPRPRCAPALEWLCCGARVGAHLVVLDGELGRARADVTQLHLDSVGGAERHHAEVDKAVQLELRPRHKGVQRHLRRPRGSAGWPSVALPEAPGD